MPYDLRLMASCASCLLPLPDGARFCPSCGQEVVTVASEERRVVTVVFADLVGYSALSEHLDPERVKRLIDAAFERLIADITEFGGSVDKVLGDGIIALFGAPVAHEDDADRAIRAAIQMHETMGRFTHDQLDLEGPLQLRIGVNTGEVVVGMVSGTAEYTAMGDVVNVAARLQNLAEPGAVLIGDATSALASDEIVRELVDDVDVRGREQTERVWRVLGRQRRNPSIGGRSDLPFVGRATQRELLASIMGMVAGGRSAVVAVSGEAGSGKTRLISEALEDFPSRSVTVYAGVCAPYGENNVWSPIATALYRRIDRSAPIPPDRLREVMRERGGGAVRVRGGRSDAGSVRASHAAPARRPVRSGPHRAGAGPRDVVRAHHRRSASTVCVRADRAVARRSAVGRRAHHRTAPTHRSIAGRPAGPADHCATRRR